MSIPKKGHQKLRKKRGRGRFLLEGKEE